LQGVTPRTPQLQETTAPRTGSPVVDDAVLRVRLGQLDGLVRQHCDGPILRYSARRQLLAWAHRQGIGRFEANLQIARTLHRMNARTQPITPPLPATSGKLAILTTIVCVQATLVGLAWVMYAKLI
jgi:hypothetical protein